MAYGAIQRKDWASAAEALQQLTTLAPGSARAWIELSYVESFRGHYRAASNAITSAARIPRPPSADLADILARLRTFNDATTVREIARKLLQEPRRDAGLLSACAMHLSNLNDHALSLECARMAVAADQGGIAPRLVRGQMFAQHGDLEYATADFEWCLSRAPGLASAWWALSRLRRQTADSNLVPSVRRLLARTGLSPADVAYASFALHKALDDLGDVEGAWTALEQACASKRPTLKYAMDESRALIDALVAMPAVAPAADASGPVPLFIVGMHRSGTTLLEQLLDGSPQVRGVGELYDFTSAMRYATDHHCKGVVDRTIVERAKDVDFGEVGRRYLDGMAWRLGDERFFTDKLPSNFLNVGFICRALPQAKILHMVRDPVETCFSNLRELFSDANPYSYDQLELADFFLQYRRLMAHWHAAYPGRILDVDYAELTRDPEAVMRKVAAFCGIDYTDAMCDTRSSTRAVATASAVQVRGVGELYDFTSAMRYATDHHCKGVIDRTIVERAKEADFAEVGQRYLDGMAWRLGEERFFTDKLPSNFLNIGFICRALPQAKILHMVRDPVETCFSNLRELFSDANPYSYDQLELADYFLQYRRLMAHWQAAYPGRILDVDYAELTRDPEAVMRKVAAFCGIDYTDAMRDPRSSTRAVATASAVQVRDRVVRREVPKWAPYAKHLQPLIGALRQGGVEIPGLPA